MEDEEQSTLHDDRSPRKVEEEKVCFVCEKSDGDQLKCLTESTWTTSMKAVEARKQMSRNSFSSSTDKLSQCNDFRLLHYHTQCYRKFTAVKRIPRRTEDVNVSPSAYCMPTRQCGSVIKTDKQGLLPADTCIFCGLSRKKRNNVEERLCLVMTKSGAESIQKAILQTKDPHLLPIIESGGDLIAKEAKYHKSCRRAYVRDEDDNTAATHEQSTLRSIHVSAFNSMKEFIRDEILTKNGAYLMTTLLDLYKAEYVSLGGAEEDVEDYKSNSLMKKIKNEFKDEIKIDVFSKQSGNLVFNSSMNFDEAVDRLNEDSKAAKKNELLRTAALHLRSVILAMPKTEVTENTTAHTLKATSAEIPDEINLFFRTLFQGLKPASHNNESIERKTIAMSSDAIFNTTKGSVIPWKQTSLGLGLSSLTGSKLVLQILNRFGHTICYDRVKEIETELAYSSARNDTVAPDGILLESGLATATAWDNYDVNIETTDGKDTLHCTVGICFQNRPTPTTRTSSVIPTESTSSTFEVCKSTAKPCRKRKSFHRDECEIPQYCQPTKRAKFDLSIQEPERDDNDYRHELRAIDFWWMLQSQRKQLPLLSGYLTNFVKDNLPIQMVTYLEPLMSSPTSNSVVRETMKRSLRIAAEVKEEYAIVTYDLAIAAKAFCIQQLEAPMFDKLLVLLGNFHIEMAFFGALGTFIQDSGAEVLLTDSGVLAGGSLNGFMKGKFYNRCTRIHQIFAAVLEKCLYEEFMKSITGAERDAISNVIAQAPEEDEFFAGYLEGNTEFLHHLSLYENFFYETMNGKFGATAAYWVTYIFLVNRIYRNLQRAVRTNDLDLYIETFSTVLDVFFALNRPNYARWGTLYLNKLKNMPQSACASLQMGAFSIRRTSKDFSRNSVDLTLEQTINRDASSSMRGIVAFRNSESAVKRWTITTAQRGMIVSDLKCITGLESIEQPATQAKNWRIRKDNADSDSLMETITHSCNPFSDSTRNDELVNIATGKAATLATKEYLLGALNRGNSKRADFENDCSSNPKRFLQPIKRTPVRNFAVENNRNLRSTSNKCVAAESVRDVFGRVMILAAEKMPDIDLKKLLSYPITEVPLALAHSDGTLVKTDKSTLLKLLEQNQASTPLENLPEIETHLIDGGLLLHSMLPYTSGSYGAMARKILLNVCSHAGKQIHVLFDKYIENSLKEGERSLRGNNSNVHEYVITSPEQRPHITGAQLLKSCGFKNEFAKFLQVEWQKTQYADIIGSKIVIVSHGGDCVKISSSSPNSHEVHSTEPPELQATHEEADTLIIYHASQVLAKGNIAVRTSDTDVIVLLISILGRFLVDQITSKIIMDCGTGNHRRLIDVTSILEKLKETQPGVPEALLGLHAFTGCDLNSAFYRKGKTKQLEILRKKEEYIQAFSDLSCMDVEPNVDTFSAFVCEMYGHRETTSVNEARYNGFQTMSGKGTKAIPMKNIKRIDCSLLPPCQNSLIMHIRRAHYISVLWSNSWKKNPSFGLNPLQFGWAKSDQGRIIPHWYDGESLPPSLMTTSADADASEDEDGEWSDSSSDDE